MQAQLVKTTRNRTVRLAVAAACASVAFAIAGGAALAEESSSSSTVGPATASDPPAPGQLDPAFGTGGIVTTPVAQHVRASALVRQSDGSLVVAGGSWSSGSGDMALVRYSTAGSLDPSFGANGIVTTDLGGSEAVWALVVQTDDKLVAATRSFVNGTDRLHLVRYLANGALDPAFGTNGVAISPIDGNAGLPYGLALQPDGKIIAAGPRGSSGVDLVRYTSTGALDSTFGNQGTVTTPLRGNPSWHGIVVQPDGKIVVKANTGIGVELARYEPNGTLDASFGAAGHVMLMRPFSATSLVLQPDGKLVMAGLWSCGTVCDFGVVRLSASGTLDPGFGTNGTVTTDLGAQEASYALALQPDGKLVAAGGKRASFPGNADFVLARYTADGALDAGFGTNGTVTTDAGGDDVAMALLLQPDGKVVAAGEGFGDSPFPPTRFVVARYFGGGAVAPPSGGGGGSAQPADLALTAESSVPTASVGETILYRVHVRVMNHEQNGSASRVAVTDELPVGVELLSTKANRGPGCAGSTTVTCNLDFLSGQLVGEIEIVVRVTQPGTIVNTATVTAAETDPDLSNNTASVTVSVPERPQTGVTTRGTAKADLLRGTAFGDVLYGLAGNDRLFGLAGNDRLFGGTGSDTLVGGPGLDVLDGGTGNDSLQTRDGRRDTLRCGAGRDTVRADRLDKIARDCETVKRR